MEISTLIVDDEPLARERIRRMLGSEKDIKVVGECGNGKEAITLIKNLNPDLIFLDIQMPEKNGFDVLEEIQSEQMPTIIFVTAYDQYAIRAFEVCALDYLLKPFNSKRFQTSLKRVREQLEKSRNEDSAQIYASLLDELKMKKQYLEKFVVKSSGRIYFLKPEEISWIEAAGNYIILHAGEETHMLRETMNNLEAKLDPAKFSRIHRSTIVNSERIKEIYPLFNGDFMVVLKDKTELPVSRNYRKRLFE